MSTSHLRNLSALAFTSAIIALGPAAGARADEPLFGYTYTTDLLPPGKWEIEQWATDREVWTLFVCKGPLAAQGPPTGNR